MAGDGWGGQEYNLHNSMVNWKTVLTSGGTVLGQVDILK